MNANKITSDVRKRVEKALENIAYDISFDIEAAYESAIDAFYSSYTPRIYDRNYYLYTGSDSYNSIAGNFNFERQKRIKKKGHKIIGFEAGIRVSGDFVKGSYKDPTTYVFERSYYYGIHGTIATGGVMPVPSERLMQMSFEGIKANLGSYMKNIGKYF